jgi:enamine deaminase RidA (YjgF/YER057c/UK114 family)
LGADITPERQPNKDDQNIRKPLAHGISAPSITAFVEPDMTNGRTNASCQIQAASRDRSVPSKRRIRNCFVLLGQLLYGAATMKTRIFSWLGREFVETCGEGQTGGSVEASTAELFVRIETSLKSFGLSLDNTVRIRVFGRDKQARTAATAARSKILAGNRKAASSSFISQDWFDSEGAAGLELLAMRPLNASTQRNPVDFDPARNYLCYLEYDSFRFFSGFTSEAATLEQQVSDVLVTLDGAFTRANTDWGKVVKLSLLLPRLRGFGGIKAAK